MALLLLTPYLSSILVINFLLFSYLLFSHSTFFLQAFMQHKSRDCSINNLINIWHLLPSRDVSRLHARMWYFPVYLSTFNMGNVKSFYLILYIYVPSSVFGILSLTDFHKLCKFSYFFSIPSLVLFLVCIMFILVLIWSTLLLYSFLATFWPTSLTWLELAQTVNCYSL